MPGVVRQADYYDLPETAPQRDELPDPKIFASLLGGPKISQGTLEVGRGERR